jgi:hypothetical protein
MRHVYALPLFFSGLALNKEKKELHSMDAHLQVSWCWGQIALHDFLLFLSVNRSKIKTLTYKHTHSPLLRRAYTPPL